MLIKTRGIVFRKIKYSETSFITDIYTSEVGLMSYIISGVRKPRARTHASVLQLLMIVDLVAYHSDRKKLHRIKEIRPAYIRQNVPLDVRRNAIVLFVAELCSKTIKETEKNSEMYSWLESFLIDFDQTAEFSNLHLKFIVQLADHLGFGPEPNYSRERFTIFDLMGGKFVDQPPHHGYFVSGAEILYNCILHARKDDHPVKLTREMRNMLLDQFILYFQLHIDGMAEMRSHKVLREIL